MPKLLSARPAKDAEEEGQVRKLASSRHAPGDWIWRAHMIVRSWEGQRTAAIAAELGCHPQTVRERFHRFNAEGLDGLGDRPGAGRKPRLQEAERSAIISLAKHPPPGQLRHDGAGDLAADDPEAPGQWTLDALVVAAGEQGITIGRSQMRRILLKEQVRWRNVRSWATSTDREFAAKGRRSSPATPLRPRGRRPSVSMNSGQ
jgi:transposase